MSTPRTRAAGILARAALRLYPPAWRARYGDEVMALLDDSGAGPRAAAGLAWHAAPTWVRPPRHLYDRPGRMRASLGTVLAAWALLAGLAVVFIQLTQAQQAAQRGTLVQHPVIEWAYWALDASLIVSVLAAAAGGLPLWLRMLRGAPGRAVMACLLAPVVVPTVYLGASIAIAHLVRGRGASVMPGQPRSVVDLANGMVGPWWLLALVIAGFAATALSAAGPGVALRRLRPSGTAVVRASRAAGVAAAAMVLAGAASVVAAVGLYLWAPPEAGYHEGWLLAVYLPTLAVASAVAIVSAARGVRAARSPVAA